MRGLFDLYLVLSQNLAAKWFSPFYLCCCAGWTPQTFSSSRKSRTEFKKQSVLDFLDEDEKEVCNMLSILPNLKVTFALACWISPILIFGHWWVMIRIDYANLLLCMQNIAFGFWTSKLLLPLFLWMFSRRECVKKPRKTHFLQSLSYYLELLSYFWNFTLTFWYFSLTFFFVWIR